MRRPENLYDKKTGKLIKVFSQLHCVLDPSDSMGVHVGAMKGETFLCEDAALFNIPLSYSAVVTSQEGCVVYRISTSEALDIWPIECQNELKLKVLEKY